MTSEVPEIIDFHKVVEPHLNGGKLVSYTRRYLTKPGDNYGSVMLAITAKVERPNGDVEELPLIAKLPPITNDMYWDLFQPERTCITENTVYKYVAPLLREIQLEAGIPEDQLFDGFPIYYGSRISLDENAKVDRNAVLVQENLQTSGFKAGNRHKMFDMTHAKLILKYIAQYHALPIALRLKKPEQFKKLVRPYINKIDMNAGMSPEMKQAMGGETIFDVQSATNNNTKAMARVVELLELYDKFVSEEEVADGLYTTISHSDMWINNVMLSYDEDGNPSKVKIVDFQIAQYESVVHDIIFFLLSSVEPDLVEHHFDEFLQYYYGEFIKCLQSVGVSTEEYTFDNFMSEVKRKANMEVPHALFMTKIILADNSTMPDDFKDMDINVIKKNTGGAKIVEKVGRIIELAEKFDFFY